MNTPPSGILTFCTGGKPHLRIEREFWEMLERERRNAVREARRSGKLPMTENEN